MGHSIDGYSVWNTVLVEGEGVLLYDYNVRCFHRFWWKRILRFRASDSTYDEDAFCSGDMSRETYSLV